MKREIKFRLWNPERSVVTAGNELNTILWTTDGEFVKEFIDKKMVWMQYTGLKDKNGKEIYEGDIVSFQNRIHEVCINFTGYYLQRYKLWNGEFKKAFCYSMCLITKPQNGDKFIGIVDEAEVIGNIYENPELLKK